MRLQPSLASFLPALLLFAAGASQTAELAVAGVVLESSEMTQNTSGTAY